MATILPFKALRPSRKYAKDVSSLPYDVYSRDEAKEYVKDKPYSFLNIDRPETQFPDDYDMYSKEVYLKGKELLDNEEKEGIFIQDQSAYYYIYELTMNNRKQTGLVALSSIDDYLNNVCLKHELTVEEKEKDRINHVNTLSAQTGPIFLTYRFKESINVIIEKVKENSPLYDFESLDGVKHRVWIIDNEEDIEDLQTEFGEVEHTYIADGHHRAASAVKVGLKRREEYPDYTGDEEFNYFLSVLFPSNELHIFDYNRHVKDLNGYTPNEFLGKLQEKFDIYTLEKRAHPLRKNSITMYLNKKWYLLEAKENILKLRSDDVVKKLDVSLLQEEVLTPLLNIQDPRLDKRISFIGGIRGLEALEINEGVSFAMYPTSIDELLNVADKNALMPPKSTWFEPKLRSGLFIHKFEEEKM